MILNLFTAFACLWALSGCGVTAWTTGTPGSPQAIANMKDKIKNVVILVMENRSLDNLLGGQKLPGLDNPINNGPFCNPLNVTDSSSNGTICSLASDFNGIFNDPDHSVSGNNIQFYGSFLPNQMGITNGSLLPQMQGFVTEQIRLYEASTSIDTLTEQVMHYYTEEEVPVLTEISKNAVVFNHWHSDHPGVSRSHSCPETKLTVLQPTNPNRLYITSGTSHGKGTNNFNYNELPQKSIFQAVTEAGLTWKSYEDQPFTTTGVIQDALWYTWTYESNHTHLVEPMDSFFSDALEGNLPDLVYLNPSCCGNGTTSMHPTGRIVDGEEYIKAVYEALRASPQWNQTLMVLTFDETGGFFDHVQPPAAVRPDNLTYTELTPIGINYTFTFDRLGGRLPTWLVSPWIEPHVEQKGTNSANQTVSYHASSILRTLGYLWDFEPFTPRVESAPSFDHLILESMTDMPELLPAVTMF